MVAARTREHCWERQILHESSDVCTTWRDDPQCSWQVSWSKSVKSIRSSGFKVLVSLSNNVQDPLFWCHNPRGAHTTIFVSFRNRQSDIRAHYTAIAPRESSSFFIFDKTTSVNFHVRPRATPRMLSGRDENERHYTNSSRLTPVFHCGHSEQLKNTFAFQCGWMTHCTTKLAPLSLCYCWVLLGCAMEIYNKAPVSISNK